MEKPIKKKSYKSKAKEYLESGSNKIHVKQYEEALLDLDLAIGLDNNLLEAHFYRGFAKRDLHLYEEAIAEFTFVLENNPKHIASVYHFVYTFSALNNYKEALKYADKLIILAPDWYSYMLRASVHSSLGNVTEAENDEREAWKIGHYFNGLHYTKS